MQIKYVAGLLLAVLMGEAFQKKYRQNDIVFKMSSILESIKRFYSVELNFMYLWLGK